MAGTYSFSINCGAKTATLTGISLTAASGKPIEILSASVTNPNTETNEQLEVRLQKITTDGGTATTSTDYLKHQPDAPSASATVKHTYTVESTYATPIGINEGISSLGGWYYNPAPDERIVVGSAEIIGLKIVTATFSSFTPVFRITWRELT